MWPLKFVRTDVHRAAGDARIAVQVGESDLADLASIVCKAGRAVVVHNTVSARPPKHTAARLRGVVRHRAIVKRAVMCSAATTGGVTREDAIAQDALIGPPPFARLELPVSVQLVSVQ